jgi:hypothetical protein
MSSARPTIAIALSQVSALSLLAGDAVTLSASARQQMQSFSGMSGGYSRRIR